MIPFYSKIYQDIIIEKFPEMLNDKEIINRLNNIQAVEDVIALNEKLFKKENIRDNQKLKSYDQKTIIKILEYQKKHNLSNTYISQRYKLSRNTVARWKKNFKLSY
ncbi:hypothetical protein CHRYSEOSP005_24340 [Chryseobacterium sp. Alg-005]|uniref:helix-turn-helix domain-containing protein n=1 Tax=Chryseobacterium sp. Alg-005 TaxID=3159516 RepID=UPI0035558596